MKLTVVIPAHNEEESLPTTLRDLEENIKIEHQTLVVDDHSTDNTAGVIEEFSKRYQNIRLVRNDGQPGFASAMKKGFSQVKEGAVVLVMADASDDPATIRPMYEKIRQGYDLVCASRYMKGGVREGRPLQGLFSKSVSLILYYLIGIPTHDSSNAFKMYKKQVLEAIDIQEAGFASSLEIIVKAFMEGFKITEVPTRWKKRERGQSKFQVSNVAKSYIYWFFWSISKIFSRRLRWIFLKKKKFSG